jgi:hypothetical protein
VICGKPVDLEAAGKIVIGEKDRVIAVDHAAAQIVCWIVAFDCISDNIFNGVAHECLAKLFRKFYEKTEVFIENRRVDFDVCEAAINRTRPRAGSSEESRRRV